MGSIRWMKRHICHFSPLRMREGEHILGVPPSNDALRARPGDHIQPASSQLGHQAQETSWIGLRFEPGSSRIRDDDNPDPWLLSFCPPSKTPRPL